MLFTKILAAYDGSNESDQALAYAVQLASAIPGTRLDVVHVFNVPTLVFGEAMVTAPAEIGRIEYEHAETVVSRAKAAIAAIPGAAAELVQGLPGKAILQYATEKGSDLIVIGSRGLSTVGEFMLGSVSHHVVQHAGIPVLVIK